MAEGGAESGDMGGEREKPKPTTEFHEGLIGKSWDEWDLPTEVTQEELQAERDAFVRRFRFHPQTGIHKSYEPNRIPRRYMDLFGHYPGDDSFSVSQCAYCGHICTSVYARTHLLQDCEKRPEGLSLDDEESGSEGEQVEEREEGEEKREEGEEAREEGEEEDEAEEGSVYSRSSNSTRSRSRSVESGSSSPRSSRYSSTSGRSRSTSRSSSESRSRSRSYSPDRGTPEEGERSRSGSRYRSNTPSSIHSGESRSRSRSTSRSISHSRSRSRSRSRSTSRSPYNTPPPYSPEFEEGEEGEELEEGEEREEEFEFLDEEGEEGIEGEYESESAPASVSPEEGSYYEVLPHMSGESPSPSSGFESEGRSGRSFLSPSTPEGGVKSEPFYVEGKEEQVFVSEEGGEMGGAMEIEVDPLQLDTETQSQSQMSPGQGVGGGVSEESPPPPPPKKQNKKKMRDEDRKRLPLKERVFNPEEHCGVVNSDGVQCTRTLTCKSHSLGNRRLVPGRSQSFDLLIAARKKARDEAKALKSSGTGELNPTPLHLNGHPPQPPTPDENDVSGGGSFGWGGTEGVVEGLLEGWTEFSWTSTPSVKRALGTLIRASVMKEKNSFGSGGGGKRPNPDILDPFLKAIISNRVEPHYDGVLEPGLYGGESTLLENPLDDSDEEGMGDQGLKEELNEWESVQLVRVEGEGGVKTQEDFSLSHRLYDLHLSHNPTTPQQSVPVRGEGQDDSGVGGMTMMTEGVGGTGGQEGIDVPKRPLSPSNHSLSISFKKRKGEESEGGGLGLGDHSTLPTLSSQLPNPTLDESQRSCESNERGNVGPWIGSEVELTSLPPPPTHSSSPPISLASLLGVKPQETPQLQAQSQGHGGQVMAGRTQPRKQHFPKVRTGGGGGRGIFLSFQPTTVTLSLLLKSPLKRDELSIVTPSPSPVIGLDNPEQQGQGRGQGHYKLHLSGERERRESVSPVGEREEGVGVQVMGSTHGTTSSRTQVGEYTLHLPEQRGGGGSDSGGRGGNNSWAALSEQRNGGGEGGRREEYAPVSDSGLQNLLDLQFEDD